MTPHYRRDDPIPLFLLVTTSVQHVLSLSAFLVFPILIGRAAGLSASEMQSLLGATLIAMGVANFLQASPLTGSGYLCPAGMTAAHLGPSLIAAKLGGLPLVFGMTLFAGASEAVLSRFLSRLKVLFPAEVTGVVILLVGVSNATSGFKTLFPANGSADPNDVAVAGITGAVMIAASVFGSGRLQSLCALIGILVGYVASFSLGVLKLPDLASLSHLPLVALPRVSLVGWSFSPALALPFFVVAFAATAKQAGFVACAARLEGGAPENELSRSISRGVMADALGTICGGLVGGLAVNVSASSSGLISATNISTRRVGYGIAAILFALGFQPHFAAFLSLIPHGIVAAVLVFTSIFVLLNGMEMIIASALDRRKTICVGLAVLGGVAVDGAPGVAASAPHALLPLLSSSLVAGTTIAIVVNAIFAAQHSLAVSSQPRRRAARQVIVQHPTPSDHRSNGQGFSDTGRTASAPGIVASSLK